MADRKLSIFLCHASQDKPIARVLYQQFLAEDWIDPRLDEEKLLPGQEWDMEIEKAVEAADAVIVCLSNNSVTKEGYVQKELRKVLDVSDEKPDGTIFVIPVCIDNVQIPRRLKMWQYVDFFPISKRPSSILRLIASLKKRAGGFSSPIEVRSSDEDVIAIQVRILDGDGKAINDFWFLTKPNIKVDELLSNIKMEYPHELSAELGDYRIDLELLFHHPINNLKVDNESLLVIRPK